MSSNLAILISLTIVQIPSFFCAIQILRFGQRNNPLTRLPNHLLVCLLIVSLYAIAIDLPFTQAFLWLGFVPIQTSSMCTFYNISFSTMSGLNRALMAFMSLERHFLVFRPQLYHTFRSRVLYHYIPLIITILAVVLYFIPTTIFVSCSTASYDYTRFMCGYTCAVRVPSFILILVWLYVFLPTAIITVAKWNRTRKMIIHTSVISGAYILCWLPFSIILQLSVNGITSFNDYNISQFLIYGPYLTPLLTPFIVQQTIPARQTTVQPENVQ
ncbi:unnamed protein product [Adineta ricciae]|uniref:G-protein coupled receptors family 1 profile domain-containing protein n=1 Tax=Adineta ricciae TaxID=249248 RepID=A0A813MKT4_ADIRI|nr:unnamed protein product [Adineta ricciae]